MLTCSLITQWTPADDAEESIVYQQKIRVAYLQPEGETIPEDAEQPSMITSDGGDLSVSPGCGI